MEALSMWMLKRGRNLLAVNSLGVMRKKIEKRIQSAWFGNIANMQNLIRIDTSYI